MRFEMKYSDVIAKIENILSDNGIDLRKIESAGTVELAGKDVAVISLQIVMPSSEIPLA
jgi:predicted regulator of amino acid metabolism with ACT domain